MEEEAAPTVPEHPAAGRARQRRRAAGSPAQPSVTPQPQPEAVRAAEEPGVEQPVSPPRDEPVRVPSPWTLGWPHLAGLAVCLATLLHFWQLDRAPAGFYVDEAGIGLAARGIALDGRDDHGVAWPLYFQSFGDWKNPVEIYLVAAAIRLFGASIWVVRAVPSALALATAVLLGLLVWDLFRQRWLAVASFLVAAGVPWLFLVGRLGFEVPAQPACLMGFLLLWRRALDLRSYHYAALAGIVLGLSAYAYSTGRLFMLLLILALVAAGFPWKDARLIFLCGVMAAFVWLPAVIWNQAHGDALTARYGLLSIANDAHGPLDLLSRFLHVYLSYFSPAYLFHNTGFFMAAGMLLVSLSPLLALGLAALWNHRHDPFWRLVVAGLVLGPVPGALTTDFGHYLRNSESAPFWLLVIALGAYEGSKLLDTHRAWVGAVLAAAIALESAWFLNDYFTGYPSRIADWNEQGLGDAVAVAVDASHASGSSGRVVVSESILGADVLYAWYAHEDLPTYRQYGIEGIDAHFGSVSGPFPAGTVVLSGASESVAGASLVSTISVAQTDDWGRPTTHPAFLVWRSN